jgi:ribosomal protein L11 methyltransferase
MTDTGKEWITLEVTVPHEMVDAAADFCHEHGSTGLMLDESEDATRITAYFERDQWDSISDKLKNYLVHLHEIFPDLAQPLSESRPLKTENWAVMWKDNFESLKIGKRLIVTPPWLNPDPEGRQVVIIEPAEAFGTGTHETTQGCLALLDEAIEELAKMSCDISLLDVGCGSGILAIAGFKLGATRVRAVDNDPVAVESARKNAALNGVEGRLEIECSTVEKLTEPAAIVTANLDPMTLRANRDWLIRLFDRFLIVAGVPVDQWDDVKSIFLAENVRLAREITRAEWGCGLFAKNK